jgi:hypothetical protein
MPVSDLGETRLPSGTSGRTMLLMKPSKDSRSSMKLYKDVHIAVVVTPGRRRALFEIASALANVSTGAAPVKFRKRTISNMVYVVDH